MILETVDLSKRFGSQRIIKDFNQIFSSGQKYAITGPNGSGKSTLLKMLCGVLPPSKGYIEYRENESSVPIEKWYQYFSISAPYMDLIEDLSLQELLQFHSRFKKLPQSNALPEELGFEKFRQKPIKEFSSGMKQKLKLALCFSTDAPIIFLDEPCTNLDSGAIDWYQEKLNGVEKKTILIFSNRSEEYPGVENLITLG